MVNLLVNLPIQMVNLLFSFAFYYKLVRIWIIIQVTGLYKGIKFPIYFIRIGILILLPPHYIRITNPDG